MATQLRQTDPSRTAAPRDYKTTLRRVLATAYDVVRFTARTIGWASHIWFNLALPLSILLAGIAIMAGLMFLGLAQMAPDDTDNIHKFTMWLFYSDPVEPE